MKHAKRHLNNDIDKLLEIAARLQTTVQHLRKLKPVRLSKRQHAALNRALRTLDIHNAYEDGDLLRKAFKVELDGLHDY